MTHGKIDKLLAEKVVENAVSESPVIQDRYLVSETVYASPTDSRSLTTSMWASLSPYRPRTASMCPFMTFFKSSASVMFWTHEGS
jgi:hypothetical protein